MTAAAGHVVREEIPAALGRERVDKVVALLTGMSRSEVHELIERGGVRVGSKPVTKGSHKLQVGDHLEVHVPERDDGLPVADASVAVDVVHEDADLLVVDKPAGLVVHPGSGTPSGTLVNGLLARYPDLAGVGQPDRPGIVHRLDAGTSGLLVVARTAVAYDELQAQLHARSVERRYWALVGGAVASSSGLIDAPLARDPRDPIRRAVIAGGREARTRYEVIGRYDGWTLVECKLETGRTHQIRAHLAAIGHPIVGDVLYGGAVDLGLTRPYLHAHQLTFRHPSTGLLAGFDSALPVDLEAARGQLVAGPATTTDS